MKIGVIVLSVLIAMLQSCAGSPVYMPAPALAPGTSPEMNMPGYWIDRIQEPDALIMDRQAIEDLNKDIKNRLGLVADIAEFPDSISGVDVAKKINEKFDRLKNKTLYLKDRKKADRNLFPQVEQMVNSGGIPETIKVGFGIVSSYSALRELPISQGFYAGKNNISFDELQITAVDIGWPVAIYHESMDGKWLFIRCPYHYGWIEKEKVAFCTRSDLQEFIKSEPFIVAISPKAEIFTDGAMKKFVCFVQMGSKLPLAIEHNDSYEVKFPVRNEDGSCSLANGFVIKSKALRGYLPYTQRNAVNQAFRMLDTPYSWGGESGWQDCSGFIQEVFMAFGIYLPRDSKDQEQVGSKINAFDIGLRTHEKISVIKRDAVPGVTAMFMKGHVMLYLGMDKGEPYAIHNIWAYREKLGINEKLMLIKRVAVTDLKLGEGSANGSLIDRENSLSVIRTGE